MRSLLSCASLLLLVFGLLHADGPGDNIPDKVRRIPPQGIVLSAAERRDLSEGLKVFEAEIVKARAELKGKAALLELLPDVLIFHHAVRYALDYGEFFRAAEVDAAKNLLVQGRARCQQLRVGDPVWTTATGLVVRGYVSKIDG